MKAIIFGILIIMLQPVVSFSAEKSLEHFMAAEKRGDIYSIITEQNNLQILQDGSFSGYSYKLPNVDGCKVIRLKFLDRKNELYLAYEMDCGTNGSSALVRIDIGSDSIYEFFSYHLAGLNLGASAYFQDNIIATALGVIVFLNSTDGTVILVRGDLYRTIGASVFTDIKQKEDGVLEFFYNKTFSKDSLCLSFPFGNIISCNGRES